MSILMPSQNDCDNMEKGDLVFVQRRDIFYRLYRKYFLKDKIKIRVKKDWGDNPKYTEYYQEDCTLIYKYELKCQQAYQNQVPCKIAYKKPGNIFKQIYLKNFIVGLYNIQINIGNKWYLTIPMSYISNGIERNNIVLKGLQDDKIIKENLKFKRYDGKHYKDYVKLKNIKDWKSSYCSVCGKPIIFEFDEDGVKVTNTCICGNMTLNMNYLSWDSFACWLQGQPNGHTVKYYKKFWSEEV